MSNQKVENILYQSGLLKIKKGENIYRLYCPEGVSCPLGEVHDVLHEMKCYIVELIVKSNQALQESKNSSEEAKQEV